MENRIAAAREHYALSQEQLAHRLNVSAQELSNWEEGIRSPTLEQAVELSRELSLPLSFLFCQSVEGLPEQEEKETR